MPDDLQTKWDIWLEDLPVINSRPIPRRLVNLDKGPPTASTLHGFCDSSSVTYGVAIYLRTEYSDGTAHSALVVATARVLPVQPITIPKAELLAAYLLAKLLAHTLNLLNIPVGTTFA